MVYRLSRRTALRALAWLGGTDAESSLGDRLSSAQVQQLVLHAVESPGATAETRDLAASVLWGHLRARQAQGHLVRALVDLRVAAQQNLYEPLLLHDGQHLQEACEAACPHLCACKPTENAVDSGECE